jgi:hypothetical protein
MRCRALWLKVPVVVLLLALVPSGAGAGFRTTRNAVGPFLCRLSAEQAKFYRTIGENEKVAYEGAPTWGYGLRIRTYSSRDVGLDLSAFYSQRKGETTVSNVLLQAGPLFPFPFAEESEVLIPYGSAGITISRTAIDVDSQLDFGFYVRAGVDVAVTRWFGLCLEGVYTLLNVKYRDDRGLKEYLEKNHSFGGAGWSLGVHYYL